MQAKKNCSCKKTSYQLDYKRNSIHHFWHG